MDPKDTQKKVEKITVEASAAKVRKLLGEAGGPIAEGMMVLKGEVDDRVNEIRAYADGADKAAKEAKAQAVKSAEALEQAELRNDSLLGQLDRKTTEMKSQVTLATLAATKAEEALADVQKETSEVNLAIAELKSTDADGNPVRAVAALQAIESKANGVEAAVKKTVDEALSITVQTSVEVDHDQGVFELGSKTLQGKEAFQNVSERVDYAARAAGDAISKANKALTEVAELKAGLEPFGKTVAKAIEKIDQFSEDVADAFATVDEKIKIMIKLLERAGVDVPQAAKDEMGKSSYTVGGTNE